MALLVISIVVEVDKTSPAFRTLDKLNEILSPAAMATFLKNFVVPILQESAADRFESQGDDAVGGAWVPLKEATKRIRMAQGYTPDVINVRTGELRGYVVSNRGDISADIGATLSWPSEVPGARLAIKYRTAQTGTRNGHVPARPVVGIGFSDMVKINLALGGFIDTAMKLGRD